MGFESLSKERGEYVSPEEYGNACRQAAFRLAEQYFPSETTLNLFTTDNYLNSLRELSNKIAQLIPVSIFQSKYLSESHDLLTRLLAMPFDIHTSNCRVSAIVMGMILERDGLADELSLMNFAFDENNLQHGRLIIRSGAEAYVAYFAAVDYSRVEPWINSRFPYPEFPLTDQGIYDFEHDLGNV